MKRFTFLVFVFSAVLIGFNSELKADVNESFDGLSQSSYGNYDYNGFHIENGLCNSTNALSGNAVRLRNAVSYLEYNGTDGNGKDGGVGSISFWYRSWDNSPAAVLDVKVNVDGAGWVNIGAQINTTSTTYAEWSYLLNNASDNILIRIEYVSGERLHIDDFSITDYAGGGNAPPIITNIFQTPASTILSSTTVSVSADVTDSDGTISSVELHWGTAQGVLGTTISMTNTGLDTYTTDTDIPAQANGTTVYYEVYAEDDDSDGTTSAELSYDVIDPSTTTLPYSQTFDSDLGDCYNYNVSGPTNNWIWDDMGGPNGHAYMNGYGGSNPEEDWLIIPGIDFDSYANEIMQFYTFYEYGNEDANNYLKLFYSSDYAGVGDPSGATWTELSFIKASAWAQWQPSFIVDLSGIVGTNVYIGFKYYSTDAPRSWRIDDISIFEGSQVNVTFQVNMSEQTVSVDGVHLAGSFDTWWDPAGIELFDPEMDNIYTTTLLLYSGIEYQFKYVNGNAWGLDEGVPVECSAPGTTNRFEVIGGSDYAIDPVCFGSCVNCGTLAEYDVTFRVDMKNETVLGGVNIAGSFNGWSNTPMTNVSGTIWEVTIPLQETTYQEYKFKNGNDGWENFNGSCLASSWGNRYVTVPSEATILDLVCFNSCDLCPVADFVMINEVDSDTPGTDAVEFIELYDGGVGNTNMSGLVVVLYNGNGDISYGAYDLDGFSTDANGYFLLGNSAVVPTPSIIIPNNFLQNGADAIALYAGFAVDFPNGTLVTTTNLIDAIVYDTDDADDSGLLVLLNADQPQINENGRGDKDNHSSQRIPNGSGGMRNTYTYDQSLPTPGAENVGIYTDWTGAFDAAWDNAGNWHNGVPTDMLNAEIPDVSGAKAPYPVISGPATCLSLYMAPGSALDIGPSGALTVNGTFTNAGGTLTIKSDATGTGSLIESNGVNATVERYLSQDAWHYISAPVDDPNTSVFTGLYMMWWDEPTEYWKWVFSADSTLAIDMQGYALWSDGAMTGNTTVSFNGALNTGSKSISVTRVEEVPLGEHTGYNFVGNPYPSAVNWNNDDGNGWTRTNVDPAIYIWNQTAGNYGTYVKDGATGTNSVDSIIPQNQGFFVNCNNTSGGLLAVDNAARTHVAKDILKGSKADQQYLKFVVEGNNYNDEMLINIQTGSSLIYDNQFDALKMRGLEEAPQFYTLSKDNKELTVNSLPTIKKNLTIPVGLEVGVEGNYSLYLAEIVAFDNVPVFLEDLKTNNVINIKNVANYSFYASPSDDALRFLLHFSNNEAPAYNDVDAYKNVNIYSIDNYIILNSANELSGTIKVYDLMGREVYSEAISETFQHEISSVAPKGYYILNFVSDSEVYTEKVFIK